MTVTTRIFAVAALLAAALACGCSADATKGYTTASQFPGDVKTVAVPIWTRGKDVYRREVEFQLTEALVKRIELNTPYKVTDRSRADTELSGEITKIEQRLLSKDPDTGLAREMEITFHVSFTWKNLKTGKNIKEFTNFRASGTYVPLEPLGEEFFQGGQDVINKIAERIVETMESDW